MRYLLFILFSLILSCSSNHDILIMSQPCPCSIHKVHINRQPCLYPLENYNFTLCRNFIYFVDGEKHVVPSGFSTDLASIPKILWSIYAPNKANTIAAAIIHDYLYFCPSNISRLDADNIFYDTLIYSGVKKRVAFQYWLAVRIFGRSHFNEGSFCLIRDTITKNNNQYLSLKV